MLTLKQKWLNVAQGSVQQLGATKTQVGERFSRLSIAKQVKAAGAVKIQRRLFRELVTFFLSLCVFPVQYDDSNSKVVPNQFIRLFVPTP